jgi:hypothetical protein
MASLRKLRRRALRWQRYETAVYGPGPFCATEGGRRVLARIRLERDRRIVDLGWDDEPWGRPVITVHLGGM